MQEEEGWGAGDRPGRCEPRVPPLRRLSACSHVPGGRVPRVPPTPLGWRLALVPSCLRAFQASAAAAAPAPWGAWPFSHWAPHLGHRPALYCWGEEMQRVWKCHFPGGAWEGGREEGGGQRPRVRGCTGSGGFCLGAWGGRRGARLGHWVLGLPAPRGRGAHGAWGGGCGACGYVCRADSCPLAPEPLGIIVPPPRTLAFGVTSGRRGTRLHGVWKT